MDRENAAVGDHRSPVTTLQGGSAQAAHGDALPIHVAGWVAVSERREHDARVQAEAGGDDHAERRGRGVRPALQLEEGRYRGAPIGSKRVAPSELV